MTDQSQAPSTADLSAGCRAEEETWLNRPSSATLNDCWELFRRAVVNSDQAAWSALYRQYRSLIIRWGRGSELEPDDLVNETFARFWETAQNGDFPADFPTIQQVKGFLKRCARNLTIDAYRRRQHQEVIKAAQHDLVRLPVQHHLEQAVVDRLFSEEQLAYLRSRLQDEDERLVFRLIYELGMKPKEILAAFPDRFPNAKAIYRIRERIVRRLVDDPKVQGWRKKVT